MHVRSNDAQKTARTEKRVISPCQGTGQNKISQNNELLWVLDLVMVAQAFQFLGQYA